MVFGKLPQFVIFHLFSGYSLGLSKHLLTKGANLAKVESHQSLSISVPFLFLPIPFLLFLSPSGKTFL